MIINPLGYGMFYLSRSEIIKNWIEESSYYSNSSKIIFEELNVMIKRDLVLTSGAFEKRYQPTKILKEFL